MRSVTSSQLAGGDVGVSGDPFARDIRCVHLATLRHFDHFSCSGPKMGPLIPCERRLQKTEIQEIQEVTSEARFGIRDYGRPFGHILVTLCGFDSKLVK